jgi:hypothetical protein
MGGGKLHYIYLRKCPVSIGLGKSNSVSISKNVEHSFISYHDFYALNKKEYFKELYL